MKIVIHDGGKIAEFENGRDVKKTIRQFCLFVQKKYGFKIVDVFKR